ncbi:MAG: AMP-binding protein, partial [bacterium]|nr:AMP-binding protein [bacterium]
LLMTGAFVFDVTTFEIWGPLLNGAGLYLASKDDIMDAGELEIIVIKNKINILHLIPQLFNQMAPRNPGIFAGLKYFLVGGDLVRPGEVNRIREQYQDLEILHMYGPTENTTFSTFYRVDDLFENAIPIGKPIANSCAYVVGKNNNLQPPGITGELWVGGDGLARGYLNNPQLTREKFVPNPFLAGEQSPGSPSSVPDLLYRTGDLAKWLPGGNLQFIGRSDYQVKIRGFRIELGEIETVLRKHEDIKESIVISRPIKDDNQLIAYITKKDKILLWPSLAEYFVYDELLYTSMVKDEARNEKYRNAFAKVVRDKTVLEIGPGGQAILARMCIEAGAKKVYAVEILDEAYESAGQLIKSLNLEDKIILIHGDITKIELPEKVDYCVSEIVGTIGGSEGAAKLINSAVKFMKDRRCMIPSKSVTNIAAVTLPESQFDYSFNETGIYYVEKVFEQVGYRFDLRLSLMDFPEENIISGSDIFEELDFTRENKLESEHDIYLEITNDSLFHGFIVWLELYCDQEEIIDILKKRYIWLPIYFPIFQGGEAVRKGDYIKARITRKLSENELNPDFTVKGQLFKRGAEPLDFIYHCPHVNAAFKGNGFYKEVFAGEQLKSAPILSADLLNEFLGGQLPGYMIPTHFVHLNKLPLTATGKLDRKALPAPGVTAGENYTAPADEIEEKLLNIWSEVLKVDRESIGVDTGFFKLGGHSLKATLLISMIHKMLNVKITLAEVFRVPTIRGLAARIKKAVPGKYASIKPAEQKKGYPLSSAQKRLFFIGRMDPESTAYNMARVMVLEGALEKNLPEQVFRKLIERHESLRTSFRMQEDQPVQEIHPYRETTFEIQYFELPGGRVDAEEERIIKNFIQPFALDKAPLLKVGLVKKEEKKYLLMVDMHHIISDGLSHSILVKEFIAFYNGDEPAPLKLQYKDFSEWQNSEAVKKAILAQEAHWLKTFEGEIPVLNLPTDFPRPPVRHFDGNTLDFKIGAKETGKLKQVATAQNSTLYMVLLAVTNIFLSKLCSREDIVVGTPIAGRRHADLEPIIGMFINTLALRNFPGGGKTFKEFLEEVRERTLEAFENQDYPFEDLVEKVVTTHDAGRNPLLDVLFALQNLGTPELEIPGLKVSPYGIGETTAKFDLTLDAYEEGEELSFILGYSTRLFREETIRRFISYYKRLLESLLEDGEKEISRLEILPEEEKTRLLYEFGSPEAGEPQDKTIHQLFREKAEQTPGAIALAGMAGGVPCGIETEGETCVNLSFKELDEKSWRLASLLMEKGVAPGSIVGILIPRSIRMIVGLLAILKAGGAYLPIAPDYPPERINYMLADSNARYLLTDGNREVETIEGCKVIDVYAPTESHSSQP